MAYLVERKAGQIEIRESRMTERGPRSRQLARFRDVLTPAVLAEAAARATRPFDADALAGKARALGLRVESYAPEHEARALLARLHRDDPIDPVIARILREALDASCRGANKELGEVEVPEHLAEVAEWIGAPAAKRGEALRQLLDTFGRIAESRPVRRRRPEGRFPRFSSSVTRAAS